MFSRGKTSKLEPSLNQLHTLYHYLKPFGHRLPSYVRDTTDVLNKWSQVNDTIWDIIVTMDVEALYTDTDHSDGLQQSVLICQIGRDTPYRLYHGNY